VPGAVGSAAAVVFPNYGLSPEARYPVALEESYAVLEWVASGLSILPDWTSSTVSPPLS
jgi:acetyl esterase/lipase